MASARAKTAAQPAHLSDSGLGWPSRLPGHLRGLAPQIRLRRSCRPLSSVSQETAGALAISGTVALVQAREGYYQPVAGARHTSPH